MRVSYAPHDWPNSYVCVTVERRDMSKFTEGIWQGSLTVNNERAVLAQTKVKIMIFKAKKKTTHMWPFRSRHLGENQRD